MCDLFLETSLRNKKVKLNNNIFLGKFQVEMGDNSENNGAKVMYVVTYDG